MLINARSFFILTLLFVQLTLCATLPELSSIDPIEYDEKAQRLIAKNDAQLQLDQISVKADRITYYREYSLADATGNVVINAQGIRLLAERLSYDGENKEFAMDNVRTGYWPYHLSAKSAGGTNNYTSFSETTLYYGTPGRMTPNIKANSVNFNSVNSSTITFEKATVRLGRIPIFYIPSYTHYFNEAPLHLDATTGSDSQLGVYLQTTSLGQINPSLRAGINLDLYTKRGFLIGPAAQYSHSSKSHSLVGAFSSGIIRDSADSFIDNNGEGTSSTRGFAEWRHRHQIGKRFELGTSLSYWSDSEVTQDFRKPYFNKNRRPDNFTEASYLGDNYLVSAFGRFASGNFHLTQQRIPEVRLDVFPIPLWTTGTYHYGSASYSLLREDFIEPFVNGINPILIDAEYTQYQRLEMIYSIQRPLRLKDWVTLTPLASTRLTHYQNQKMDTTAADEFGLSPNNKTSRQIHSFGFDLEARAHANYPTINKVWGINGLRHTLRPIVKYRYYLKDNKNNQIAAIERRAFNLSRPIIDLNDMRYSDTLNPTQLLRIGVENLYQTRSEGYGSRNLASLNVYQDVLLDTDNYERYDNQPSESLHASWVELMLRPAPWLRFDMSARFKTKDLTIEQLMTRSTLINGETWQIGLSTDMLRKHINQYRIDFICKLSERYALFTDVRFDGQTNEFTHTRIGINTKIGNLWQLIYALTFRNNTSRESDFSFTVNLRLNQ